MSAVLKLAAVLMLVMGLFLAEQHIEQRGADRQLLVDQAVANKLKIEAAQVLATETAKTLANQTRLSDLIAKTETDRETLQIKNRADLRSRSAGPRLQFAAEAVGRGDGGGGAQSPAPGASSDPTGAVVQLPAALSGDLWDFASDAESLAIDYGVLWRYVHNPKLVCELRME